MLTGGAHSLSDFVVDVGGRAMELPDGFTGLEEVLLDEKPHLPLQVAEFSLLHFSVAHSRVTSLSPSVHMKGVSPDHLDT